MIVGVGRQFLGTWTGVIHGVFTHSVNLRVTTLGIPAMLTLLSSDDNMGERCLAVSETTAQSLFPKLVPGMDVSCTPHRLSFSRSEIPPLDVASHTATAWYSPAAPRLESHREAALRNTLKAVWDTFQAVESRLDSLRFRPIILAHFDTFIAKLVHGDPCPEETLRKLIGAGPGLTPSGDDMLVGLLCALHGLRHPLFESLHDPVSRLLGSTTFVSQSMVDEALGGTFYRPLAELRYAIMAGEPLQKVNKALDRAVCFGASSGCDGTRGLLLGLQYFHITVSHPEHVFGGQPADTHRVGC
ncbi:DUF2877 domain-containing protein [Pseudodesulfovibrio sp. JC047]|uniref:DUF2877 domain-containing protein n=1 Tax=Pseudodesulfovibrio sp. JC047 TaxID=2683199 RepID=UPI0013D3219D|nr:DUF2877 domain-containing protein [Pseudodesulfovibrio sp. JC047]NDV18563.1 DUF2877 domain-containing protein [Pseudodesulfovibrio sp. JC047]